NISLHMVEPGFENKALKELRGWQALMLKRPGLFNGMAKRVQTRINKFIPEKIHQAITTVIKQMIRGVLFGAEFTSTSAVAGKTLAERELIADSKIDFYRKTAAVEGGITGAG